MLDELWTEVHDIVQDTEIKTIHKKRYQKGKMAVEEALQLNVKRREAKRKGEKEIYTYLNAEFLQRRHTDGEHMKRCSTSLFIREMQINSTMRYHFMLVRMSAIKKSTTMNAGEGVKKR